jgi:hypothetical protein
MRCFAEEGANPEFSLHDFAGAFEIGFPHLEELEPQIGSDEPDRPPGVEGARCERSL